MGMARNGSVFVLAFLSAAAFAQQDADLVFWQRAEQTYATSKPVSVSELPKSFSSQQGSCAIHFIDPDGGNWFDTDLPFSFRRGDDAVLGLSYADVAWKESKMRLLDSNGELGNGQAELRKVTSGGYVSWMLHTHYTLDISGIPSTREEFCWATQP